MSRRARRLAQDRLAVEVAERRKAEVEAVWKQREEGLRARRARIEAQAAADREAGLRGPSVVEGDDTTNFRRWLSSAGLHVEDRDV
jgi:hypothetical protein